MRESSIQREIIDFLLWKRCVVYRMNSGKVCDARSGAWIELHPPGTPDLLVGLPSQGHHIIGHIETKRSSGGQLNDNQVRELRTIHKRGSPWLVADCLADAERWLTDWGYHGDEKYTKAVTDESERFVFPAHRKNAKMTMASFHAWNRFQDGKK